MYIVGTYVTLQYSIEVDLYAFALIIAEYCN